MVETFGPGPPVNSGGLGEPAGGGMDRAPGRGSHKASESDELVRPGPEESGRPDEPLNFCPVCGSVIGRGAVPHEEHRVTSLTRRSVLWADRIAATSSSSGDVKFSSMCASGYSRASSRLIRHARRTSAVRLGASWGTTQAWRPRTQAQGGVALRPALLADRETCRAPGAGGGVICRSGGSPATFPGRCARPMAPRPGW
jgi:hypothetical protein